RVVIGRRAGVRRIDEAAVVLDARAAVDRDGGVLIAAVALAAAGRGERGAEGDGGRAPEAARGQQRRARTQRERQRLAAERAQRLGGADVAGALRARKQVVHGDALLRQSLRRKLGRGNALAGSSSITWVAPLRDG